MELIKNIQARVQSAIEELDLSGTPANLYDPLSYIVSLGGKRIRPVFVLLGSRLFEGKDEEAIPAALAIELFHNFSLIHDDIMDKAPLRRGKQTVHEKWNADIAILSGDALFVKSYQQLSDIPSDKLPAVFKIFNEVALRVCEGQQFDMNFETESSVSISEYLKMIEYKTSALLGGALQIGGIIGGANADEASRLYNIGRNIGLSFQLKDDLLDAFGEGDRFGKKAGGDIAANKKTILFILAMEKANDDQRRILLDHYGIDEDHSIQLVLELFKSLKVDEEVDKMMNKYYQESIDLLHDCGTNLVAIEALKIMAHQLMIRDY